MLLRFSPYAWAKMLYLRDVGNTEVSFMGITPSFPDLVEDVLMIPQKNTSCYTEMKDEGIADFQMDMIEKGLQPSQFMRIWCHTHPGNGTTPSTTDENTFSKVFGTCNWAIMFILGKDSSYSCRFSYLFGAGGFGGKGSQEIKTSIDWDVEFLAANKGAWKEEYDKNVETTVYTNHSIGFYANNWQNGYKSWNIRNESNYSGRESYNHEKKIWEPIPLTKVEITKPLTKREQKYIKKHGSLVGFIPPANDGKSVKKPKETEGIVTNMIKLEHVQEVKDKKLEVTRNLLGDMSEEEANDDLAQELLDEATIELEMEIDKLEHQRDVLEQIQLVQSGNSSPDKTTNDKLEEISKRLCELEYELYHLSGYDDDTQLETTKVVSDPDKEWLDEAASVWTEETKQDVVLESWPMRAPYYDEVEDYYGMC